MPSKQVYSVGDFLFTYNHHPLKDMLDMYLMKRERDEEEDDEESKGKDTK